VRLAEELDPEKLGAAIGARQGRDPFPADALEPGTRRHLSLDAAAVEKPLVGCVLFDVCCFPLFRDVLGLRLLSRRVLMGADFVFWPLRAAIGLGYRGHMIAHRGTFHCSRTANRASLAAAALERKNPAISGIGSPSTSGWLPNISAGAIPRTSHICRSRPGATAFKFVEHGAA
jgi:hypothetical protein